MQLDASLISLSHMTLEIVGVYRYNDIVNVGYDEFIQIISQHIIDHALEKAWS